jgi:hypothetical protein
MLAIELGGYVMGALGQRCLLKLAAAELFGTEGLGTGGGNKETVLPLWKGFETFGIAHGASTQVMLANRKIVQA